MGISSIVMKKEDSGHKGRDRLRWYHLLLLAFFIIGNEGTTVFAQVNNLLTMQYLGVPTSLSGVNMVIGGCLGMLLLPLCGMLTDRGDKPQMRKVVALAVISAAYISAFTFFTTAALIKIGEGKTFSPTELLNTSGNDIVSDTKPTPYWLETDSDTDRAQLTNSSLVSSKSTEYPNTSVASWIPVTGILAILGFTLVDLGFDLGNSFSRAFALDHCPRSQHKSILMMISTVAPVAGAVVGLIGVLDLPGFLGHAFEVEGSAATLVFFSILLMVIVTTATLCTTITGVWVAKTKGHLLRHRPLASLSENSSSKMEHSWKDTSNKISEQRRGQMSNCQENDSKSSDCTDERKPLLVDTERRHCSSSVVNPTINKNNYKTSSVDHHTLKNDSNVKAKLVSPDRKRSKFFTKKLLILLVASYTAALSNVHFIMYIPHTLTISVYHGDPQAAPGSKGNYFYVQGLRSAALGNTLTYIVYFIASIMNKKLLNYIGEKRLFFVIHVIHATTTAMFVYGRRLELFYVCMIIYGLARWTLFTIPYMMANELTNESMGTELGHKDGGKSKAGRVASVITIIFPINYITSAATIPPLMAVTGDAWIPIILSVVASFMSAVIFLPLLFIK